MTISFPLSFPSDPAPVSVQWIDANSAHAVVSPYTLQSQIQEFDGSAWMLQVSYDPMTRIEAQPIDAILSALRGPGGTFIFGDTLRSSPLGLGGGSPKVMGADQTGRTLITDGWSPDALVLKAGDMFAVNSRVYKNLTDATTNGSGEVTLDVWPKLREHPDNADIVYENWTGLFRLAASIVQTIDGDRSKLYNISFLAEEAL